VKKERSRGKRLFAALLIFSWFGIMALAGFFMSSLITQIPLFRVKEIVVEGNKRVDFELVKEIIEETGESVLSTTKEELLSALKVRTGDRIKEVFLSREFGFEGITLRIRLVEREPVARVAFGKGYLLTDAEGVFFTPLPGDPANLPLIKTYDMDILREHFPRLYRMVFLSNIPVRTVIVKKNSTLLVLSDKILILPPLELLPEGISDRIKMIYNLPEERVDLRYDRFILVRN